MRILIDIMSGDNAPLQTLLGAVEAAEEYGEESFVFIGDEQTMRSVAAENNINIDRENIEIVQSNGIVTMDDAPLSVVREKKDSSMGMGLKMLAEGKGDAFVSAGNTGALHAGSTLIVRRIKGVQKSAIGSVIPYANPTLLIDSGANIEINPPAYVQFAHMGTVYMKKMFGIEEPRVGLLNIGAEECKGTKTVVEAYKLLKAEEGINFIGNVEGKEIPHGVCDVIVADGFSGNILLKLTEGCASFFVGKMKNIFTANALTKLSAVGVKNGLKNLKRELNASEYGGAPILGLSRTVIKAHGGSDAYAIKNAIRQAIRCVNGGVVVEIAKRVLPELKATDAGTSSKQENDESSDKTNEN